MMTMPRSFAVTSVPFHSRTPVVYSTDILSKGFAVGDSSSVVSFNISRSISIARAHRANRKLWIKHRIEIHMSASPKSGGSVSVTNLNGKSTIDRRRFGNVRGKRRCQEDPRSNHREKDPASVPEKLKTRKVDCTTITKKCLVSAALMKFGHRSTQPKQQMFCCGC